MHEKVMLNIQDIMQIVGIGRDKAYEIMHSNQFPVKKIGKKMFVHKDVFDAWLKDEFKMNKRAIKGR